MNEIPDYMEILGARFRSSELGCGVSLRNRGDTVIHGGALFKGIDRFELRSRLNEAMHVSVEHYTGCASRAGVAFTSMEIMEVSFRVVLYILGHRDIGGLTSHQGCDFSFATAHLLNEPARSICWVYCETMFPTDYACRTAGLTEMSLDAFGQYEQDRRPEMREKGLLAS
jgi:hypothetical protein